MIWNRTVNTGNARIWLNPFQTLVKTFVKKNIFHIWIVTCGSMLFYIDPERMYCMLFYVDPDSAILLTKWRNLDEEHIFSLCDFFCRILALDLCFYLWLRKILAMLICLVRIRIPATAALYFSPILLYYWTFFTRLGDNIFCSVSGDWWIEALLNTSLLFGA